MIVMVSNNTSWRTHFLQGKYGGLGLLLPPNGLRGPYPHLPHYAMDNGAYPAWKNQEPWDQAAFEKALDWASEKDPPPSGLSSLTLLPIQMRRYESGTNGLHASNSLGLLWRWRFRTE